MYTVDMFIQLAIVTHGNTWLHMVTALLSCREGDQEFRTGLSYRGSLRPTFHTAWTTEDPISKQTNRG